MNRNKITLFGEKSNVVIKKTGLLSYGVYQNGTLLAKSRKFKAYQNDILRIMYTGIAFGTGDYILEAESVGGIKEIYRWKGFR